MTGLSLTSWPNEERPSVFPRRRVPWSRPFSRRVRIISKALPASRSNYRPCRKRPTRTGSRIPIILVWHRLPLYHFESASTWNIPGTQRQELANQSCDKLHGSL
jgi:hypothetical protein